jgi:hypothetical protein
VGLLWRPAGFQGIRERWAACASSREGAIHQIDTSRSKRLQSPEKKYQQIPLIDDLLISSKDTPLNL